MNEIVVVVASRLLWLNFSYLCNHCSPTVFNTDFVYCCDNAWWEQDCRSSNL